MEETEYTPSLFGMTLRFNADSTVLTNDGTEDYITTWAVSYGSAVDEGDILTISEDGQLIYNALDCMMIFSPVLPETSDPEAAEHDVTESEADEPEVSKPDATGPKVDEPEVSEPDATGSEADEPEVSEPDVTESEADEPEITFTPVGEEGIPFLGTWTLEAIEVEGMTMSPALLGMSMTLTFTDDGQVSFTDDLETNITAWHVEDGAAIVEGTPLTINEKGKLVMADDGALLIFTLGEVPTDDSEADDLLALLELLAQMEETGSAAPAFDYLDAKFVCTEFISSGATLDAAMLGAEYAVYFRESGVADLTLAGYTIENLP